MKLYTCTTTQFLNQAHNDSLDILKKIVESIIKYMGHYLTKLKGF